MDFENEKIVDIIRFYGYDTLTASDEKIIRNFLKDCYNIEIKITELEIENKSLNERLSYCEKEIRNLKSKEEY